MRKIIPAFLIVATVFVVYAPSLRNGFVWDDTALILRDPLIRSWRLIPEGFRHFLFTDATPSDFYRPIQRLTYTLEYAAFDFHPAGYHLVSILTHILAALGLLLLSNQLLRLFGVIESKRRCISFLATLIWAVHPTHTAAVIYISGLADPLAATFGFLGLCLAIPSLARSGFNKFLLLFFASALFLLSALSKEMGIVFPFLWGAVLLLQRRWKEVLGAVVVLFVVLSIYLPLRLSAEHIPVPTFRPSTAIIDRPIVAAQAFTEYAGLTLLPVNLHMDRGVKGDDEAQMSQQARVDLKMILGILIAGGILFWLARTRQADAATYACVVLGLLTYLPVSGIFSLNATVAEHWLYLPAAFLFVGAGVAISRLSFARQIVGSVLALWFLFLAGRTWKRTFEWKDQRTFLERTIAQGGDSTRMLINLAGLELKEAKLDAAKRHLDRALQKQPEQPLAIINLASVAVLENDFATARDLLDRAVKLPFVAPRAYELLAVLKLRETGQIDLASFRLAAKTGPPDWSIEKRYIQALDQDGQTSAAIAELKSCLITQWYRAESWKLLSELLSKVGQESEAADALARAKKFDVHLDEHAST